MTVSSSTTKVSYTTVNATTHSFAYTFKIFADADLQVVVRDSSGTEVTKTLNTNYVVTGAASESGGNVLFKYNTGTNSDAHYDGSTDHRPANGSTVIIKRNLTLTQGNDYIENDPFSSADHENALDRLTFIAQQQQEEIDRTIKASVGNTISGSEFTLSATDRANKLFSFDSSGNLSVTQEIGTLKGNWATSTDYVVRDLVKDTSTNNIFICVTAHTSSGSQPLTTNSDSAKWSLIVDAASATTSASTASTQATNSAASAVLSSNHRADAGKYAITAEDSTFTLTSTNGGTSGLYSALHYQAKAQANQTAAASSASAAATSATAASNAQSAAEAALDTFDDRFLGAKSTSGGDPTQDNDGNSLQDGAIFFDTTNDIMKVYDLTNTTWRQLTPTSTNQGHINTVSGIQANVTTVAGISSNVTTVAGISSNVTTVAGISSNVTSVAGNSSNINAAVSNASNINSAVSNASNINSAVSNASNINTVAGAISNINTTASNISGVNSFAERYRIGSSNPTSSLDNGDLFFNSTSSTLLVYGSSGWQNAGSSVNGTSQRYTYNISGTPSSVTGSDANSNTLAYDAGFIDVFLNGVRLSGADITITSGDTITFASALADGDVVDAVAYGTFNVAQINADNINSGTVPIARLGTSGTKNTTTFLRGDNTFATVDTTNASNLSTGTLPNARLSSVPNSALANSGITINGSAIALGGSVTVETDFTWETKTSAFNAEVSKGYFVDTSSSAITATLPASPSAGDTIRFIDLSATFDTNNLTVARNSKKIQGDTSDMTVATERAGFALVFSGDTQGWLLMEK